MTALLARSPLHSLPMPPNRPATRRRSVKQAFDDGADDAPAVKKVRMNDAPTNGTATASTAIGKKERANGAVKKGKAAYEEEDDGFQFARRTTRRAAKKDVAGALAAESGGAETREKAALAPARRKKSIVPVVEEQDLAPARTRRRSARLSGDKEVLKVSSKTGDAPVVKHAKRTALTSTSTSTSVPADCERNKRTTPAPQVQAVPHAAFAALQTPTRNELHVAKKRDPNAQRIMLPFADTPVITRNKEMRKGSKEGHRRSSTGLRGRRASSLMDSGLSNALPHSEVEVRDFYKYIEQSLPEPRRMKQLLVWCGSRALPEKPSGDVKDANAIMAARAIQQELIEDFANKPELSDWFSREETEAPSIAKKPNPQNEKNKAMLLELDEEIRRLEEENSAWETLAVATKPQPHSISLQSTSIPNLADIDTSLLDPSQATLLAALQAPQPAPHSQPQPNVKPYVHTSDPSSLPAHLHTLSTTLEPTIDTLASGIHILMQYRQTAERVADRILGDACLTLEKREEGVKGDVGGGGVGVGDVLRGLAGVLVEQ